MLAPCRLIGKVAQGTIGKEVTGPLKPPESDQSSLKDLLKRSHVRLKSG
jgi:hypothetical protein